jgi:hypothetical protein
LEIVIGLNVSRVGFQALAKLEYLREVLFPGNLQCPHQGRALALCAQFVPNLRIIGHSCSKSRFDSMLGGYHDGVMLKQRQTLKLEELALSGDVEHVLSCKLPELRTLMLSRPTGDIAAVFDSFQNLSTLILSGANMVNIESVLQRVGWRLGCLSIDSTTPKLLLGNVVGYCPNLKILTLKYRSGDVWNLTDGCSRFLEELNLDMDSKLFPPGFIVQVRHSNF